MAGAYDYAQYQIKKIIKREYALDTTEGLSSDCFWFSNLIVVIWEFFFSQNLFVMCFYAWVFFFFCGENHNSTSKLNNLEHTNHWTQYSPPITRPTIERGRMMDIRIGLVVDLKIGCGGPWEKVSVFFFWNLLIFSTFFCVYQRYNFK